MLAKDRLLDLVENFILFDDSKPGATRKVVARNHQVLGVNNAVASVAAAGGAEEALPRPRSGSTYRIAQVEPSLRAAERRLMMAETQLLPVSAAADEICRSSKRAHPDLGQLGVFWHTQGSGKSYSMAFFAEKVRRTVPGNFTFLLMTDREDLDNQIYRTFVGCGVADEKTPRAASGKDLQGLLKENHRYVFSLIHKFNQDVNPERALQPSATTSSSSPTRRTARRRASSPATCGWRCPTPRSSASPARRSSSTTT